MKKSIRRQLDARKRRTMKRIDKANWNGQSPMLTCPVVQYELAEKTQAIACGGIGVAQQLVRQLGIAKSINRGCPIFKFHMPYSEADHVLNIAFNLFAGGNCLEHLELRRNDDPYLDAPGAQRISDASVPPQLSSSKGTPHAESHKQKSQRLTADGCLETHAPSSTRSPTMDQRRSALFQRRERRAKTIRRVEEMVATVVEVPIVQPVTNRKAIEVAAKVADVLMVTGQVVIQSSRRWMLMMMVKSTGQNFAKPQPHYASSTLQRISL